jgi:hypothetical protein
MSLLSDLTLRLLYYQGATPGVALAEFLRLPWAGVVEAVVDFGVAEKLLDLRGGKGFGRASVELMLTEKGREHARDALERSTYVGPAPVPLQQYVDLITRQAQEQPVINQSQMLRGLAHLTVGADVTDKLGPAINSSRSLFLYGPPGNGKTSLADAVSRLLGGEVYVPNALEVGGQVIKVFDPLVHRRIEGAASPVDQRWHLCHRPSVVVGGELTLENLDLIYSESSRFYEAPFQVKANGGMLLIDDFGRQKVAPKDLLNRWIVPLEKRVDYLTLHTGKKFEIPFEQLIVFSTNLDPQELVDEAFLRRIKYKIEVADPDEEAYREIFQKASQQSGIPFVPQAVTYLLEHYYKPRKLPLRACHPRDIVAILRDIARFQEIPPSLSKELLDKALQVFLSIA